MICSPVAPEVPPFWLAPVLMLCVRLLTKWRPLNIGLEAIAPENEVFLGGERENFLEGKSSRGEGFCNCEWLDTSGCSNKWGGCNVSS